MSLIDFIPIYNNILHILHNFTGGDQLSLRQNIKELIVKKSNYFKVFDSLYFHCNILVLFIIIRQNHCI